MLSKRSFMLGALSSAFLPASLAQAHKRVFKLDPRFEPQTVRFSGYSPGTLVVDPGNHFLYLQTSRTTARRYGVGVGRAGLAFRGSATIGRKAKWPSWTPTKNMLRSEPEVCWSAWDLPIGRIPSPTGSQEASNREWLSVELWCINLRSF